VGFLSLLNRLISHEAGSLGVSVGFNTQALPVFSQWKNEAGKRDSGWTGDGGAAEPLVDLTKGGSRLERCRPILQRLGQMFASDSVGLFKVRQRARDLEQSMG
jgi:hypothetical protein